jgi:hypothetical protein
MRKTMSLMRLRSAGLLHVLALIGALVGAAAARAQSSPAPSGACFDIVRSLRGEAAGTILLNHCTGQSWILAGGQSRHSVAFRWVPIAIAEAAMASASPAPQAPARATTDPNRDKSFANKAAKRG